MQKKILALSAVALVLIGFTFFSERGEEYHQSNPKNAEIKVQDFKKELYATPQHSHGGKQCQTKELADSNVLALSWQPAFCERFNTEPECAVKDPNAYVATHFSLHGLWPNKKTCGTDYGFCGKYKKELNDFCDYDPVPISKAELEKLGVYMPSAVYGTCLQRHEWNKHGTCQALNATNYFNLAIRLTTEFSQGSVESFMAKNIGKTVSTQSFFDVVDETFGTDAHKRLQISCTNNQLSDVFVHMPKDIPNNASLKTLIHQAEKNFSNDCGESFKIVSVDSRTGL